MEWNILDKYSKFKYSKKIFGGAGIQTAALAFWWIILLQHYSSNRIYGMEQVGLQLILLNTAKIHLAGGAGTQTAALAFGGEYPPIQEQQNYGMEQVGQLIQIVWQQLDMV
jgi:hypothetical protein